CARRGYSNGMDYW
nr:immunoglobulin heavy chain junction region [Mus musculus]